MYDSALFQVFKRDDRGNGPIEPPSAAPPRLLKIEQNRARSLEEWYSLRLRVLAERGAEERLQLQQDLVCHRSCLSSFLSFLLRSSTFPPWRSHWLWCLHRSPALHSGLSGSLGRPYYQWDVVGLKRWPVQCTS